MSDERLVTVEGRVAFVKNLFNANKKGRYTLAVVFDQDENTMNGNGLEGVEKRAGMNELKEMVGDLVNQGWPKKKPSGLKTPLKVEERSDMLEKYPFMKNRITVNASNGFVVPVGTRNENGEWVDIQEKDLKAGDYVEVSLSGYTYDNETKGVGLNVHAVLKTRDGEAFYSRQSGADMFGMGQAKTETQQAGFDNFGF